MNNNQPASRYYSVCLVAALALFNAAFSSASTDGSWFFKVYLDEDEIGYHHFHLSRDGSRETLTTEANFNVSFLMIPVFSYRHNNTEIWENQCLRQIEASTRENGELYHVNGAVQETSFELSTGDGEKVLPPCISTFAYWDKSFLDRNRLLNSQTGEYLPVEVTYLGMNPLPSRHQSYRLAHQYRLETGDTRIELWYSNDSRWLALQSPTKSGRLISYIME